VRRTATPQGPKAPQDPQAGQAPGAPTDAVAASSAAEPPYLAFLGPVRAWSGGCPLLLGPPRQRAVLALLALRAGQEVTAEELVDGLHGEGAHAEDASGWAAEEARREADRLRSMLSGPSWPGSPSPLLRRTRDGYRLDLTPDRVDGIAFERLVGAAHALRRSSPADSADLLQRAFALWRGTPLSGVPGPFAAAERIRLQAVYEVASDLWRERGTDPWNAPGTDSWSEHGTAVPPRALRLEPPLAW
jgi:hypothetical protein